MPRSLPQACANYYHRTGLRPLPEHARQPCTTIAAMSLTAPLLSAAQALAADAPEIIVAYAGGPADIPKAWGGLELPHLQALLATMSPSTAVKGDEMDFSPPHERVLARAMQAAGMDWNADEALSAVYDTEQTARLFCKIANAWPKPA